MRRQLLCGAIVILGSVALAACQPYPYGYDRYYGYGPYGGGPYGYGPYGAYPAAPGAPIAPGMAPATYIVPQSLSQASYNFVINAALSDSYEIQAGRMAAQRGGSQQVRQFADRMVRDHSMTTQQLAMVLQSNGTPVVTPQALDPRHVTMMNDLAVAQGADFDRRYAIQQVSAHREAVELLQNYVQSGDNPALRQWAMQTLPTVQEHLQMALMLPGAVG
jgi:predicted outer membrane protein